MRNNKSVLTIGTFDGVHKGHEFLIQKTLDAAKKNNLKSVVVTLAKPVKNINGLLSSYEEKIDFLKNCGIDEIVVIAVPSEILNLSPDEFYDKVLIDELNVQCIICGIDFAFGKNRVGNIEWLLKKSKKSGVEVNIIKPLKILSKIVSSSHIRNLLHKSDVESANKLLGREYSFSGSPFREKGIGTKIGFPTINIKASKDKILPYGVYVSLISQGDRTYPSVTSIGNRPTLDRGEKIVTESHVLDFNGRWNKRETTVHLIKKIRAEKKFKNLEALKKAIAKDITTAKKFFNL
ncbi:MAG: bifunctional riboflavin kinase/FAD synthetase [Endomicrobium sp.]|jgi:riboflavin kinase/FMN adenylyltransferase|nr:bifunctional riboflavin kinase/FAD synthetase [Endomicrobium sp.]